MFSYRGAIRGEERTKQQKASLSIKIQYLKRKSFERDLTIVVGISYFCLLNFSSFGNYLFSSPSEFRECKMPEPVPLDHRVATYFKLDQVLALYWEFNTLGETLRNESW